MGRKFSSLAIEKLLNAARDDKNDIDTSVVEYARKTIADSLNPAEIDTLKAVHDKGPLWVGDLPSKNAEYDLNKLGIKHDNFVSRAKAGH